MDSRTDALRGLHILVVDDDRDAREILNSTLTYCGAFVSVTSNAKEALKLLRAISPDLVVADIMLGATNGIALLGQARRERNVAPFIAVSGADFDERDLQRVGFAAYLRKPLDHNQLVDAIRAVMREGPGGESL